MKWIDTPPVWLVLFIVLAWLQSRFMPLGLSLGYTWAGFLGGMLLGGGLILIVMASLEFRRAKTTIIPHETPSQLIQSGIFSKSRNPIYLGDALILAGLILRFDAVVSLVLVPIFVWVIEKRFIVPEEDRMRSKFRSEFARYCEKVRRWL